MPKVQNIDYSGVQNVDRCFFIFFADTFFLFVYRFFPSDDGAAPARRGGEAATRINN